MCDTRKSILIGVMSGLLFGLVGVTTSIGMPIVLIFGMIFAGSVHFAMEVPTETEGSYMNTDYK